MAKTDSIIPIEHIASQIYLIRGQKVMLDQDLAALYGVETRALNQAVTRNRSRFPEDFMFRLGFDGSSSQASSVHLELVFSGRSFNGAFLLIDQEWGILGRNVLNRIPILYDGPRLVWAAQGVKES